MTAQTFKCSCCGGVFEKARPDEEAMAESRALFGEMDDDDLAIVCDDCFLRMRRDPMLSTGQDLKSGTVPGFPFSGIRVEVSPLLPIRNVRRRFWRERLFGRPWRPFLKLHVTEEHAVMFADRLFLSETMMARVRRASEAKLGVGLTVEPKTLVSGWVA